jgi:hypothetical protein
MSSAQDGADRARLEAELADAWGRYHALRRRKSVRAALAVANVRSLLRRRDEPPAAAAQPVAPAAPQPPHTGPPADDGVAHCWPLGHFYSPVPDTRQLGREPSRSRVWPQTPRKTPGIDWREELQVILVRDVFIRQEELLFADGPTGDLTEYHTANDMFSRLDAWALQAMLRWLRPAHMIEVGSGWSSLVAARINREFLGGTMNLTCVDPYPAEFLGAAVSGISRLLEVQVQDVPLDEFAELGRGDVLFIDSSHVIKTGSDCQYLYHEVLPRLRSGVVVHVHDIFLPWDYPEAWVLAGRGWNEQYLLQAFLTFNDAFEILLANAWMCHAHPEVLAQAIRGFPDSISDGGGSLWMRRR